MEVVIVKDENKPYCPHGPMLLFSSQKGRFFACSSCRNGECPTKIREIDWQDARIKAKNEKYRTLCADFVQNKSGYKLYLKSERSSQASFSYCLDCNLLFDDNSAKCITEEHSVKNNLSPIEMEHPSSWLPALSNDTVEAQYFFSQDCIKIILNVLERNEIKKIICIGAPSIHETVKSTKSTTIKSLLLDIDKRFYNFNTPEEFLCYNMFNNHFFGGKSDKNIYEEFLTCGQLKDIAIVMDPPFGGRIEPLVNTLAEISSDFEMINKTKSSAKILPTIWVFPYFAEPHICNLLPELKMHDYQVQYENHTKYKKSKRKKTADGTPVRIYTNFPLATIDLSKNNSYKYCSDCEKYVATTNKHCSLCGDCTSKKHGMTYVHCNKCKKCVKPTYVHCNFCHRCCQRNHNCGDIGFSKSCYNCKQTGHKRYDCPTLKDDQPFTKKKRT